MKLPLNILIFTIIVPGLMNAQEPGQDSKTQEGLSAIKAEAKQVKNSVSCPFPSQMGSTQKCETKGPFLIISQLSEHWSKSVNIVIANNVSKDKIETQINQVLGSDLKSWLERNESYKIQTIDDYYLEALRGRETFRYLNWLLPNPEKERDILNNQLKNHSAVIFRYIEYHSTPRLRP